MCHICYSFHRRGRCVIRLRLQPRLLQFLASFLRNCAMRLFIPDSVGPPRTPGFTSPKCPVDLTVRDVRKSQLIKDIYLFISLPSIGLIIDCVTYVTNAIEEAKKKLNN